MLYPLSYEGGACVERGWTLCVSVRLVLSKILDCHEGNPGTG